jgi:two-component system, cell cycle sensor histidine kinase and response regulator CckA
MKDGALVGLIVDDEIPLGKLVEAILSKMGFQTFLAHSEADALQIWEDHGEEIDLLLTDLVMPDSRGDELAAKLVSEKPGLVALFMSGNTADMVETVIPLVQGVNFIQKPFSRNALMQLVTDLIQSPV